jgi:hypothetical protein
MFLARPEQREEVAQVAVELSADPEKRRVIERVGGALKHVDVAGLTPWPLLVLLTWLLLQYRQRARRESQ